MLLPIFSELPCQLKYVWYLIKLGMQAKLSPSFKASLRPKLWVLPQFQDEFYASAPISVSQSGNWQSQQISSFPEEATHLWQSAARILRLNSVSHKTVPYNLKLSCCPLFYHFGTQSGEFQVATHTSDTECCNLKYVSQVIFKSKTNFIFISL